jgi:hypothetical protein
MAMVEDAFEGDEQAAQKYLNNKVLFFNRMESEWNRLASHALSEVNKFWADINARSGGHALSDWMIGEFDAIKKGLEQDKKDFEGLKSVFEKVTNFWANTPSDETMKVLDDVKRRHLGGRPFFEEDFKALNQQKEQTAENNNKLLGDIDGILKRFAQGAQANVGGAGDGAGGGSAGPGVGVGGDTRPYRRPGGGGDGDATPAKPPEAGDKSPASVTALPGGRQTAEQAGIKPEFPVDPNVNWKSLDAEYLARMNEAYRHMPIEERRKFKMISGYRPATRAEARALGMPESSSQEDIWERSGHGTRFAAAPPGRSHHQSGQAGDYSVTDWLRAHGAEYGITGIGASYDYPHIQMAPGDRRTFIEHEKELQRSKIDQADKWTNGAGAITFSFKNVPRGVKTNADADGFDSVKVQRSNAPLSHYEAATFSERFTGQ